jgi:hypothetical protein
VTFAEAHQALIERTRAALGKPADGEVDDVTMHFDAPEATARRLLSGAVSPDEMDVVIEGLGAITNNALVLATACATVEQLAGSLHGLMAQQLLLGILLGRSS